MKYLYLIEQISHLYDEQLVWDYVNHIGQGITPKELAKTINYFVLHLKPENSLPGLDRHKLLGIRDWCEQRGQFTDRQFKYSILTMASYWNQLHLGFDRPYQYHGHYDGTNYDRGLDPFYD